MAPLESRSTIIPDSLPHPSQWSSSWISVSALEKPKCVSTAATTVSGLLTYWTVLWLQVANACLNSLSFNISHLAAAIFRFRKCMWENIVYVPQAGVTCEVGKYNERNQLVTWSFAKDPISSFGPELVSRHLCLNLIIFCCCWEK